MATKVKSKAKADAGQANAQAQLQAAVALAQAKVAGPHKGANTIPVPGAPGAAAPPVQAQPFDPNLAIAGLQATQNIQLSDADSAWQQGQLTRSSGFDQAGNLVTSGDAFSPFSQAMQLQDSFKASKLGTQNSYASQGQFNSGAYGRAQNRNGLNYARDFDALKTSAAQGYHGINQGRLQTYASNSQGVGTTDFNSLRTSVYGS